MFGNINNSTMNSQEQGLLEVLSQPNTYVPQDTLENEILNHQVDFGTVPEDYDLEFLKNFTAKGGKFVYCESKEDFKEKLNIFLTYNEFGKSLVWEENLYDHIKSFLDPTLKLERMPDEAKVAISTCDYLIADEGSIILNTSQNQFRTLTVFPDLHILIANHSQIRFHLEHAVTDYLRQHQDAFPFLLDLSLEEKPARFAVNKPVLKSRGTKNIIIFYCEEGIMG